MSKPQLLSAIEIEGETRKITDYPPAEEFCHIDDGSGRKYLCGRSLHDTHCKPYEGEAICPSCGLPTCPRCAVLASLVDRLEEIQ